MDLECKYKSHFQNADEVGIEHELHELLEFSRIMFENKWPVLFIAVADAEQYLTNINSWESV